MEKNPTTSISLSAVCLHRAMFSGYPKTLQLPLTAMGFTGESALLTISMDFANCVDIPAQYVLSGTICLAAFHATMKIKRRALCLKLLKKK